MAKTFRLHTQGVQSSIMDGATPVNITPQLLTTSTTLPE